MSKAKQLKARFLVDFHGRDFAVDDATEQTVLHGGVLSEKRLDMIIRCCRVSVFGGAYAC